MHSKSPAQSLAPWLADGYFSMEVASTDTDVWLDEALRPEFKEYNRRVLEYAKALAKSLGCSVTRMVSRQTDTGLMLVDLWPKGLTGAQAVISLEAAGLT